MTTDTTVEPAAGAPAGGNGNGNGRQQSLSTAAARNLATTTKTTPQMQGITSRWLLRMLPWVRVSGGVYRVNRRLTYLAGRGRVSFSKAGDQVRVIPPSLTELPALDGLEDAGLLTEIADRFVQQDMPPPARSWPNSARPSTGSS